MFQDHGSNRHTVDECSILAFHVVKQDTAICSFDSSMLARHRTVIQHDRVFFVSAEGNFAAFEQVDCPLFRPRQEDQSRLMHAFILLQGAPTLRLRTFARSLLLAWERTNGAHLDAPKSTGGNSGCDPDGFVEIRRFDQEESTE